MVPLRCGFDAVTGEQALHRSVLRMTHIESTGGRCAVAVDQSAVLGTASDRDSGCGHQEQSAQESDPIFRSEQLLSLALAGCLPLLREGPVSLLSLGNRGDDETKAQFDHISDRQGIVLPQPPSQGLNRATDN